MLSLDVESLFTNVPLDETLAFLERKLEPVDPRLPLPTRVFLDLIRLCVQSTSFSFNGQYYSQTYGVAMGSSLSPVLANLYMEFFESELMPTLPLRPSFYCRFVDDIFAVWPHEREAFPGFLDALNGLSPSIRFKVEWENEGKLPFLDALVHSREGRYMFSVYRKPMHSGMYINFFSHHALQVKRSVASGLFLRALKTCDPEFLEAELDHVFASFTRLAYPRHVLEEALSRARRTFYSGPSRPQEERLPTLVMPAAAPLEALRRPLQRLGCDLALQQPNTLRRTLVRTSPPNELQVGTYAIPCKACPLQYIGETGAGLQKRVKQHRYDIRRGN